MKKDNISEFYAEVTVDENGTPVEFGFISGSVLFINIGPNDAFIAFGKDTATTDNFKLKPNENIPIAVRCSGVAMITATGETATVRVFAMHQTGGGRISR